MINVRRHLPYIFTKRHIIISFGRHNLATILINLRSKNLIWLYFCISKKNSKFKTANMRSERKAKFWFKLTINHKNVESNVTKN